MSITKQKPVQETEGRKFDQDKPRWDLVQPRALQAYVEVLTYGARKYEPDNWRKVPDGRSRYFAADLRHIWAWWRGEQTDPESGHPHLAHAMCCLTFLLEPELELGDVDAPRKMARDTLQKLRTGQF